MAQRRHSGRSNGVWWCFCNVAAVMEVCGGSSWASGGAKVGAVR